MIQKINKFCWNKTSYIYEHGVLLGAAGLATAMQRVGLGGQVLGPTHLAQEALQATQGQAEPTLREER